MKSTDIRFDIGGSVTEYSCIKDYSHFGHSGIMSNIRLNVHHLNDLVIVCSFNVTHFVRMFKMQMGDNFTWNFVQWV